MNLPRMRHPAENSHNGEPVKLPNMISIQSLRQRRCRLAERMQKGVAIIPTAPEQIRNRDAHFPYRFDSYFYYLTGF